MKTLRAPQVLFAALLILKVASPLTGFSSQRYDQRIPAVELKEVEITASRLATLCEVRNYKGELIPSVELNAVTISAAGNYVNDIEGIVKVTVPGKRTPAVAWKGKLIPSVQGEGVTITASRVEPVAVVTPEATTSTASGFLKVSVRQTFDRVGGFLLEESKRMLQRIFPGQY